MKTTEFDGLYDLTKNFKFPAILENHIFTVAKRLSESDEKPYDGGYWKSEKIGDGRYFWLLYQSSQSIWIKYEYSPQLERFSNTWGRRWKSILRDAWNTGGYPFSTPRDDIPYLQRLRNTTLGGSL